MSFNHNVYSEQQAAMVTADSTSGFRYWIAAFFIAVAGVIIPTYILGATGWSGLLMAFVLAASTFAVVLTVIMSVVLSLSAKEDLEELRPLKYEEIEALAEKVAPYQELQSFFREALKDDSKRLRLRDMNFANEYVDGRIHNGLWIPGALDIQGPDGKKTQPFDLFARGDQKDVNNAA